MVMVAEIAYSDDERKRDEHDQHPEEGAIPLRYTGDHCFIHCWRTRNLLCFTWIAKEKQRNAILIANLHGNPAKMLGERLPIARCPLHFRHSGVNRWSMTDTNSRDWRSTGKLWREVRPRRHQCSIERVAR